MGISCRYVAIESIKLWQSSTERSGDQSKRVLEAIQEDEDLRQYIEKKFRKQAEDIFNYAALDI